MKKTQIIAQSPELLPEFERINKAWISKYFTIEKIDEEVLGNPQKNILDNGGKILFAQVGNAIVGTVALRKLSTGEFELTKMGVDESHQGQGIGGLLIDAAIEKAKEMNIDKLVLFSNRKLEAAISLYFKKGFLEVPVIPGKEYSRCNIKMEIKIK